jgi:hypothetical protein
MSYLYARGKKIKKFACQTCLRNVRRSHVHYLQSKIEIACFFMRIGVLSHKGMF